MFSRHRFLGGQPDGFKLLLSYQVQVQGPPLPTSPTAVHTGHSQLDQALATEGGRSPKASQAGLSAASTPGAHLGHSKYEVAQVEWTSEDSESVVVARVHRASVNPELVNEYVHVRISSIGLDSPGRGIIKASAPLNEVELELQVEQTPPQLRRIEFTRKASSGAVAGSLLESLLDACDLEGVTRLRCDEGMTAIWGGSLCPRLIELRLLNLAHCAIPSLPAEALATLTNLQELRLSDNRLNQLPKEIGQLVELRRLVADNNQLTSLPVELRQCTALREVSLESNRLTTPVMDLRALSRLQSLQLFGNPLDFLPELSPCTDLRHLSLANVRISADAYFSRWEVQVLPASYISRTNKLAQLFALIFRRSSCQQPLLAGALGRIAEDPANCAAIAQEVGAIQQLILMALSDNEVVVQQACKVIGLLGRHNSITTNEIIAGDVVSAMLSLICSHKHKSQLAGLQVLGSLAFMSDKAAEKLLTPRLQAALEELIRSGPDDVKCCALETVGNLAFPPDNRSKFLAAPAFHELLCRMAGRGMGLVQQRVCTAAIRALAILGKNDDVRQSLSKPPISGRGIRVLSMDGGGMKGIATIRMLRQLEQRTGKPIRELFDLVCGTSTGGILAVALSLQQLTLDDCEDIYRNLGQRVFSKPVTAETEGWRESLYRVYKSGQQSMRVAVYGCKHDAVLFELLLQQYCHFTDRGALGDTMIDTASLGCPKCFVVATWASMAPAEPFLFRNYEYSHEAAQPADHHPTNDEAYLYQSKGSSKHLVWQAVRASSAAPYYLADFTCGPDTFQDGAATANNPSGIALAEAARLWPDVPVECLISLGSGSVPVKPREKSMSAYLDTGSVLIESACNVERVAALLCTLAPQIPGFKYFRFNPLDVRCGIQLDEIDPAQWALLEAATDDYILSIDGRFQEAAEVLLSAAPTEAALPALPFRTPGGNLDMLLVTCSAPWPHGPDPVAAACQQQPQCRVTELHRALQEGEDPVEGLARLLQPQDEAVDFGLVHLALQLSGDGLVLRWEQELQAIIEPGPQALEWMQQAGADPESQQVASLFSQGSLLHTKVLKALQRQQQAVCVQAGQMHLLSSQTSALNGQLVSSHLVQKTTPAAILIAEQVPRLAGAWQGRTVATTAALPQQLTAAFLRAGAEAVVCAREPGQDAAAQAAFFRHFYQGVLGGRLSIVDALSAAGDAVPALSASFACYYLLKGQISEAQLGVTAQPETLLGKTAVGLQQTADLFVRRMSDSLALMDSFLPQDSE